MGQAVLDGVGADAQPAVIAHLGDLLSGNAQVAGDLAHKHFAQGVDGFADLGAAFLGGQIRALVRGVAADDLVSLAPGGVLTLHHGLDHDTDAAGKAGLVDHDFACRRSDPIARTGARAADVRNNPLTVPAGVDQLGQLVDARCHAAWAVDVQDNGLDLGVIQRLLNVRGQHLGTGRPADLGKEIGVTKDRPHHRHHGHAIAHGDLAGVLQPFAALGFQGHRIAQPVGYGQQVIQGSRQHQPGLRGSQLECSRHG